MFSSRVIISLSIVLKSQSHIFDLWQSSHTYKFLECLSTNDAINIIAITRRMRKDDIDEVPEILLSPPPRPAGVYFDRDLIPQIFSYITMT